MEPGAVNPMRRGEWILGGIVVLELAAAAGGLAWWYHRPPQAPPIDPRFVDPLAVQEMEAAARCRTPEAWAKLAEEYLATGYFPQAEACYRQSLQQRGGHVETVFRHAFTLERLGRIEEAIAAYEQAAALGHPRPADVRYYVAKCHLRLGRDADAATIWTQLPDVPIARYELAVYYWRTGQYDAAERLAMALDREFPTSYPPAGLLHRIALMRGDAAAAARWADTFAYRSQPLPTPFDHEVSWIFATANSIGSDRYFRDAGRAYQVGQWAEAERLLRQALAAGWSPEMADRLAEVQYLQGDPAAARRALQEVVEQDGPTWEVLWRLGQAYAATGQPQEALQLWKRAAAWATGRYAAELLKDLADWYEHRQQPEKAKSYRVHALVREAVGHLDDGQPQAARPLLQQAVQLDPAAATAWFFLGEAERLAHNPQAARAAYRRCLELQPHHGRAAEAMQLLPQQ